MNYEFLYYKKFFSAGVTRYILKTVSLSLLRSWNFLFRKIVINFVILQYDCKSNIIIILLESVIYWQFIFVLHMHLLHCSIAVLYLTYLSILYLLFQEINSCVCVCVCVHVLCAGLYKSILTTCFGVFTKN